MLAIALVMAIHSINGGQRLAFGAVCPGRGAGLVLPRANTAAMNAPLVEIAGAVAPGAHALVILDGAGRRRGGDLVVPPNLTLLKLPPYASQRSRNGVKQPYGSTQRNSRSAGASAIWRTASGGPVHSPQARRNAAPEDRGRRSTRW